MVSQDFITVFLEIYNAGAALVIIFLLGQILLMMHRVDKNLLKARLFLNEETMSRTWMYFSIAGAAFATNAFVKIYATFTSKANVLKNLYLIEITQLIFIIAFILAIYS
ncbi:MAG: hypothetical protein KJ714_07500, partial [Euryarchaeota archaeon]|nr:hypothetical protein [Euryarchaeota archaeon]